MNAAILAIGTEVTSGQIKNSHAAWIATQIEDFGLTATHHLAVPDDHDLILDALDYIKEHCEFIFITGGLGPTSDDFTRNVVADWLDCELIFDEELWKELQTLLTQRGVKVSPSHKNQCYFPEGAKILRNPVGTAHGFYVKYEEANIWVLPGPTPELHAIWKDQLIKHLRSLTSGKTQVVKKWRCLGMPESELADIVEDTLKGSQLQTGYRLVSPYVEVKVWIPIKNKSEIDSKWLSKLEHALSPWLISRDEHDIGTDFLNATLKNAPLTIIDELTQGRLSERLMSLVRENSFNFEIRILSSSRQDLKDIAFDGHGYILKLTGTNDKLSWNVALKSSNNSLKTEKTETLKFQSLAKVNPDRLGKIMMELSLKKALSWLTEQ